MGMDLSIFDADIVSEENIATQLHPQVNLGFSKVVSLSQEIERHVKYRPNIHFAEVDAETDPEDLDSDIIISAVDSIDARKAIWPVVKSAAPDWYIDMRMGAERLRIYSVYYTDFEWYDALISQQSSENMPVIPCTEKATAYTAFMAAGWAGAIVRRIATRMPVPRLIEQDILQFRASLMWPPDVSAQKQ
jgi:hypothetical protein